MYIQMCITMIPMIQQKQQYDVVVYFEDYSKFVSNILQLQFLFYINQKNNFFKKYLSNDTQVCI